MARQYFSSDGGVINETVNKQYVSSDGGVVNETGGSTSATSTISWTESNDTCSITASVSVNATGTISWTEADDVTSITVNVSVGSVSSSLNWTEANDTMSVTASVATSGGTLTTGAFKNNTGSVLASLSGLTVAVLDLTAMTFVKVFTSQTTNGSGVMVITDPLIVAGTQYAVVTKNASNVLGVEKYQAT
jgi:hypothetical protein